MHRLYPVWLPHPACLFSTLLVACCGLLSATASAEEAWTELFDGRSLAGWVQKNGTATYRVEDGTIVGRTSEGSPNSFLCSEQDYGDFELVFEVKVDNPLNSGVQIRSQTRELSADERAGGQEFGRVNGPQVEIEAANDEGSLSGYVYGEATGRGWLTPDDQRPRHS
ncbi:MAG: DUF1080 domain-containing protein, partial [Planctomycetales bacterium]|nr:DUF1080 domain-containing protein [Planctomycetales bacterium]